MIYFEFLIFVVSMAFLLKGSDLFVEEAARVAKLLGISDFVIGLTLVSVGTSLPELATSIFAAFVGNSSIVLGDIIGSNIANIGLVLGIATVLTTIALKNHDFIRDAWFFLGVCVVFLVLSLDKVISFTDSLLLLVIFFVYIYLLIKRKPEVEEKKFELFLKEFTSIDNKLNLQNYEEAIEKGLNYRFYKRLFKAGIDVKAEFKGRLVRDAFKRFFYSLVGVVLIYFGAKYLVRSTINIATFFMISPEIIALTAIAVGTSLPELFVTIASIRKKLSSILVGNIIGSGIANILLVGGISGLITPLLITTFDLFFYIPFMIFMGLILIQFIRSKWVTRVLEGALILFFYGFFLLMVFLLGTI